jgi:hypothetical protein
MLLLEIIDFIAHNTEEFCKFLNQRQLHLFLFNFLG